MTERWHTFLVYGDFADPATGLNFFVCRIPSGRQPWTTKFVPAVKSLLKGWTAPRHHNPSRPFSPGSVRWTVSGSSETADGSDLWTLKKPSKYQWTKESGFHRHT